MTEHKAFLVKDHIGGTPITVDGVEVGRIIHQNKDGTYTVWIDPDAVPFSGWSPELSMEVTIT